MHYVFNETEALAGSFMYASKSFALRCTLIVAAAMNIFSVAEIYAAESGNNAACLKAVKTIGKMEGVCDAAVLYRDKAVLASVILETSDADIQAVEKLTEDFLERTFKGAKEIHVAVNDGAAVDILELAYRANDDIPRRSLNERFTALLKELCG